MGDLARSSTGMFGAHYIRLVSLSGLAIGGVSRELLRGSCHSDVAPNRAALEGGGYQAIYHEPHRGDFGDSAK